MFTCSLCSLSSLRRRDWERHHASTGHDLQERSNWEDATLSGSDGEGHHDVQMQEVYFEVEETQDEHQSDAEELLQLYKLFSTFSKCMSQTQNISQLKTKLLTSE